MRREGKSMNGIMSTFLIIIMVIFGWLGIAEAQPGIAAGGEDLMFVQQLEKVVDPEKSSPAGQKVINGGVVQKRSQPGQPSGTPPQQPPQPIPPPEKAPAPKPAPPQVKPPDSEPSGTGPQLPHPRPHPERPQPKPSVSHPSGGTLEWLTPAVIAAIISVVGAIIVALIGLLTRRG